MTTTPPEAPSSPPAGPAADQGPRVGRDEVRDLGRIRRTVGPDRKLAGVAGGLARHLDIDPVLLRVAFVVLVFFGGAGILLYVAFWLLVPEDGNPRAAVHLDERNRTFALIGVGGLALLALLADSIGQWGFPWPLVGVAAIALIVLTVLDRDKNPAPSAPPVPHTPDPTTGQFVPAPPGTPVAAPPAYRLPPRNPRKRGPILFWFTMALSAVGIGVLGILDLAGAPIADPAYPAVVVGACGLMLLLGAFYGRAGGLIFIGLVASVVLLAATAVQDIEGSDITRRPLTAADVPASLDTSAGELILDLSDVQDVAALNGKVIHLAADVGRIEVILPGGLSATVAARIDGPGHIELFGDERGGIDISDSTRHDAGTGTPEISIDADLSVGEIQVHEEDNA
jgi:phage shock protein PspC (stress-responsive transcriptional regulator)